MFVFWPIRYWIKKNNVTGVVVKAEDVTEQKRIENELREAKETCRRVGSFKICISSQHES
jgi:hypothetical protein